MRILRDLLFEGGERIQFKNDIDLGEDEGYIFARTPIPKVNIIVIIAKLFDRSISHTQKALPPNATTSILESKNHNKAEIENSAKAARANRKALINEYLERNNGIIYLPTNYVALSKTEVFQHLINS